MEIDDGLVQFDRWVKMIPVHLARMNNVQSAEMLKWE